MPTINYIKLEKAPIVLPPVYALAGSEPTVAAIDFANNRVIER